MSVYSRLGLRCEASPSGYKVHTPYIAVIDENSSKYLWPDNVLALFRKMEEDLEKGFLTLNQELNILRQNEKSYQEQIRKLQSELANLYNLKSKNEQNWQHFINVLTTKINA